MLSPYRINSITELAPSAEWVLSISLYHHLRRCGDRGRTVTVRVARDRRAVRPSIDCEADVAGMATTLQGSGFRVVFGPKSPQRRGLPRVGTQAAAALEGGASND